MSADEHKHSPARIRYSNKVLYTMSRTIHRLRTDVLSFVGCQNSTNFKLASLGMRGAQERALLVSDDNIGTYGSCTRIRMKTTPGDASDFSLNTEGCSEGLGVL